MGSVTSEKFSNRHSKPVWVDLAVRYADARECLAAFLAFETAEVLAGIKPSTLINIADRRRRCGRNLYQLWQEHGRALVRNSSLEAVVMADRPGSLLLLLFDRAALARLLAVHGVRVLLGKAGYGDVADLDRLLVQLAERFAAGGVPHEIGVVLGYPLKDVAGFMGVAPLRFTCQGPWRIYGDPQKSLQLAEAHRQCRCHMAGRLLAGCRPVDCLSASVAALSAGQALFVATS
jgi:hypothetical protein